MIMDWFFNLFTAQDSIAHIALLYSLVIAAGVLLGKLKVGGISLGVTFVLFAGIIVGHAHFTAPLPVLTFMQDFGLMLFVFCIGLQVGPGFFESFRRGGITLNLLSTTIILLNIAVMFGCYYLFFDTDNADNLPMMIGALYGAVTNTPGLGAADEALNAVSDSAPQIASGYACAYPLGVLGIIGTTILIRIITRTRLQEEESMLEAEEEQNAQDKPYLMTLKVSNASIVGHRLQKVSEMVNRDFVCTRIHHDGLLVVPNKDTLLSLGDEALIVCAEADAEAVRAFIGPEISVKWKDDEQPDQPMISRRIIITNPRINGKTLVKLRLSSLYGVNVTRITRQDMDLFAGKNLHFHVGDRIMVVGRADNVERVADMMGNSVRRLDTPNIATIFIGIIMGILFGSIPFHIPGMPVPLKLGIAGGPLIIAILIGRFGHHMRLVTYVSSSANMMLREVGLALFLASVGIKAGDGFWETVTVGDGLKYVGCGFLITVIPILIVGCLARLKFRLNYFTLMGMIAGTYTDPPALAFANSCCAKEAPAIGYSTVYPLSMFLRIFTAQLIVLICYGG